MGGKLVMNCLTLNDNENFERERTAKTAKHFGNRQTKIVITQHHSTHFTSVIFLERLIFLDSKQSDKQHFGKYSTQQCERNYGKRVMINITIYIMFSIL